MSLLHSLFIILNCPKFSSQNFVIIEPLFIQVRIVIDHPRHRIQILHRNNRLIQTPFSLF